jgi:hypothetical protein
MGGYTPSTNVDREEDSLKSGKSLNSVMKKERKH